MNIEKTDQGFRLSAEGDEILLDLERFEDIYYAIPLNTTGFYRLLTEAIPANDDERAAMLRMIEGADNMDTALQALQDQVQAFKIDE